MVKLGEGSVLYPRISGTISFSVNLEIASSRNFVTPRFDNWKKYHTSTHHICAHNGPIESPMELIVAENSYCEGGRKQ